jgi:hypothetical protein
MAFGAAVHGINGAVYISGAILDGANAWSINIETQMADYLKFGDSWVNRLAGAKDWSGNVAAVHDQDAEKLQLAAIAGEDVSLLIYPQESDTTTYYSGRAIFSFSSEGGTDAAVAQSADFSGHGALAIEGFS